MTQNGLAKEAIIARREKEELGRQNYKKILDGYLKDEPISVDGWAKTFATQFMGGTFQSTAVDWAVNNLNQIPKGPDDNEPRCILLNRLIRGTMRQPVDKREEMLSPLLEGFKKAGNHEMIAHLRKACLEPENRRPLRFRILIGLIRINQGFTHPASPRTFAALR